MAMKPWFSLWPRGVVRLNFFKAQDDCSASRLPDGKPIEMVCAEMAPRV